MAVEQRTEHNSVAKTLAFEAVRDQIASLARRKDLTLDQRLQIQEALAALCTGMIGMPTR